MTINQINPTAEGLQKATAIVANELTKKGEDPLNSYALVTTAKRAYENVQTVIIPIAIEEAQALYPEEYFSGRHFVHEGAELSVQRTPVYDYAGIQSWERKAAAVALLEAKLKSAKLILRNHEKELVQKGAVAPTGYKEAMKLHM